MKAADGLRIALAGATGLLGREVVAVLQDRGVPVAALHLFATDGTLGEAIEFGGDEILVESRPPRLDDVDVMILCAPREASLDLVREALRAEVACIDCSGSLARSAEVPLVAAGLTTATEIGGAPLLSAAAGPALAWARVLAPIAREAGLERAVGTVLRPASHLGRAGIDVLSEQTIALLTHQETEETAPFERAVAFDLHPAIGIVAADGDGETGLEAEIAADVRRLLAAAAPRVRLAVTAVQVPAFVGDGSTLAIETERALAPEEAAELLVKTPEVELWEGEEGPSTRDIAGRDAAVVGRLRRDPSLENGLLLWVASDALRMTAVNAVALTEMRLRMN